MFGFLIGGASLLGLIWVLKGGRRHGRHGGRTRWLNMLFERLDTSPGQEKAIRAAVGEVMSRGRELRDEMASLKKSAADALRDPAFDASKLDETFARQNVAVAELQKAAVAALASIHDALDEKQRTRLADFVGRGPRRHACGGPYRTGSGPMEATI